MVDHSEFPWGPEPVEGLLTPVGVAGWIIAGVLALILINALRQGPEARRVVGNAILDTIYDVILKAARYALRQGDLGILGGADVLRRTVKGLLGGVLLAGGGLQKHLKKLDEVVGDKEEKKDDKKGAHGPGHGPGQHEPHHVAHETAAGAVNTSTETVHGHSITLNIGTDVADRPGGGHGDHGHGSDHDHEKPPTLEEHLILARKAVREFEAWWSDKPARMAELLAARDDLTTTRKLDPALVALLEEKKAH